MKRIVLVFGLISGGILTVFMCVSLALCLNGKMQMEHSEIVGYTSMVLAFVMVFMGIRSYRENVGGGAITFAKAFQIGILITLISSAIYVGTWEFIYHRFTPHFEDQYAAHMIERMEKSGASAAAVAAKKKEMEEFKKLYANPLFNVGVTFLEVFPVGLVMTLISAGVLRKELLSAPA